MDSITRHYELVLMFDINQDESMTASTLDKYKSVITENSGMIQTLAGLGSLEALGERSADGLPAIVTPLGTLYLDLTSSIDVEAEKTRLAKELENLNKLVAVGENKLKNQKFVESAPEKVVAGARKQLAETTEKRDETQRILEGL